MMALSKLSFTKDWKNPSDFPTYEPYETQVRADLQILFDEIKTFLNSLIDTLESGGASANVGVTLGEASMNLQAALNSLYMGQSNRYTKQEVTSLIGEASNNLVENIEYTPNTGVFSIKKKDGTTSTIDTVIEKVPANFELLEESGVYYLKVTNQDGSYSKTDVSTLMQIFDFVTSSDISWSVTGEGITKTVTATIRANSIGPDKLSPDVTTMLENYVAEAESAMNAAVSAKQSAAASQSEAETAAETAAARARESATESKRSESYAVGGTGTRTGEDTDNAMYYKQQAALAKADSVAAKNAAISAQSSAETAQSGAEQAKSEAAAARDEAVTAKNDAETARDEALSAQSAAEQARTGVVEAKTAAETARDEALTAQAVAETAQSAAETAQAAAETAQSAAETAQSSAETAQSGAEQAKSEAAAARDEAVTAKNDAETARDEALSAQSAAEQARTGVVEAKTAAETARDEAVAAKTAAETARDEALTAKTVAETAQSASETAQSGAETAQAAAETARDEALTAKTVAETAQSAAETAQSAAETAKNESISAKDDAVAAKTAAEVAKNESISAKDDAVAAKTAAETARDQAQEIVGGDFATQLELQAVKETAEQAKSIAKGRATGYVFDTLADLETALTDEEFVANLVLGDNFYIRALDVPDYWWDGTQKQELETEKPDLSSLPNGVFVCQYGVTTFDEVSQALTDGLLPILHKDSRLFIYNETYSNTQHFFVTHYDGYSGSAKCALDNTNRWFYTALSTIVASASNSMIDGRNNSSFGISTINYDYAVKQAICDGKGAAWTEEEKIGAWKRQTIVKTSMGEIAVAGASYYLGEQTEVNIVLPDNAQVGQMISVSWYNGETPANLSITGTMLAFDYTPSANTRSEINALWDGTYWFVTSVTKTYSDILALQNEMSSHTHDDRYYMKTEIDNKVSNINAAIGNKTNKSTISTSTMSASGWSGSVYSFESTYPHAEYDIEIALDSTATSEQAEAFNVAQIVGSATSNVVKAYGIVPTVDIPIFIKAVMK